MPIDIARGVVFLRAVNLAKGHSGARRIVVEKLVDYLTKMLLLGSLKKDQ